MKKLILLLFVPLISFGQILYGLKKTENGSSTIPFDVVNIDPFDGSTSIVLSTNSLIGVAAGATTYDQMNSRYICWGYDNQNNQNLYVMDLANLQTEINPFNSEQAIEMEYDLQNQKTYGLWWDGSAEHFGLEGKIDFLTGTLGKALGGASGGFICAKKGVVELLKQKSRPYLFSNALSPSIVKATLKALELVREQPERRRRIFKNTIYFRKQMKSLGFNILGDEHPITPVMLGDANVAQRMSKELLNNGIYAVGFSFPVVPKGMARIRLQIDSEHTAEELDKAIKIFKKVGTNLKVI